MSQISTNRAKNAIWSEEEDQFLLEAWKSALRTTGQVAHGFVSKMMVAMPHRSRYAIKYRMRCLVRQGKMPRQAGRSTYALLALTEGQYGWLAGMLDGEGSIRQPRAVRHDGIKNGFTAQIVIGYNTDLGIVNRLKELVPQATIGIRENMSGPRGGPSKTIYHVVLSGFVPLLDYIEHVLPYMAHGPKIEKLNYMRTFITGRINKANE